MNPYNVDDKQPFESEIPPITSKKTEGKKVAKLEEDEPSFLEPFKNKDDAFSMINYEISRCELWFDYY